MTAPQHEKYDLPVIDLSGFQTASDAEFESLAEKIGQACRESGFFYIVGHGVDSQLQARMFSETNTFFSRPDAEKNQLNKQYSKANRGYEPVGNQTLEAGAPPDLKEGFYIGLEHEDDHPMVLAGRFNYGKNQWPESADDFKETAMTYIQSLASLAETLMSLIAVSLKLPKDYFQGFCTDPLITLRLLHYPPQPVNALPNEKGCGAHTDFGGLTLLLQDDNGGLQVWGHEQNTWLDATPIPGSYVVNLGDMIARWTNDHYRSTLHRVINKSGTERYSIPFFFSGHPDHEVCCIPTCLAEGEAPKYSATTVEAHMREMYQKTYG